MTEMRVTVDRTPVTPAVRSRAKEYFQSSSDQLNRRVDRMFLWLLTAEWPGMIVTALLLEPRVWNGASNRLHPHVWAAILAGPAFILPSIFTAHFYPGRQLTRHVIAAAQILISILLIDITGGRIETHFHVFGSLAFLAMYRDWRVLITASVLTALDHLIRGIWWPQSVYGVLTISPWRWVEHAWWVSFEDFFLIFGIQRSIQEMWMVALGKAQLYEDAFHDVLTGLANRRFLKESFESSQTRGQNSRKAVLFIDLDRFKQANDTLGHTIGDKLLAFVAERLKQAVSADQMLARVGGDEFVVLLNDLSDVEEATYMGSRLLGALASPFEVDGHRLMLSATVGISVSPDHGTDLPTLQERADKAMYVAKLRGRNQCAVYSPEVDHREKIQKEIDRDLHKAWARGEFCVHFQPLVDRNEELTGFEALLRWTHPDYGNIPPSDFIPLAERSGLIIGIGEWVLAEACRQCHLWEQERNGWLGIAVNVSAVQFEQPDFPERVRDILREFRVEPSLLTLEITESALVRDLERTRKHIDRLRQGGIRVALDDFGTGYSSLSYLRTLSADAIKLDREFVHREFGNSPNILGSIIDMAHRLGLEVIAEGIENREQAERLQGLDCDGFQGFYFGRPLPAESAAKMVGQAQMEHSDAELAGAGR